MGTFLAQLVRSRRGPVYVLVGLIALAIMPLHLVDSPSAWLSCIAPPCLFKRLTHLPCPGCGMTRSLVHLAHGDLVGALLFNPVGPLLFAMLLAVALAALLSARQRQEAGIWIEAHGAWFNAFGVGLGVALLVNGIARIAWIVWGHHASVW